MSTPEEIAFRLVDARHVVGDEGGPEFIAHGLEDDIEKAISDAIAAEREACAKIAEGYEELSGRVVVGHDIAQAIRARKG